MQGASDSKLELRKACVSQLSIILSGPELREAASELLKKETNKDLRKRLTALARDIDIDGSEDEKNRKLAPLEKTIILLPEMENDDFESEKEGDFTKLEIECNPNIYPDALHAKLFLKISTNSVEITSECMVTALIDALKSYKATYNLKLENSQ